MTADRAQALVAEWAEVWNAHDLEGILSHYSEDIVFSSPFVIRMVGAPSGEVHGLEALRVYFERSLAVYPDIHFEPIEVLPGAGSVAVRYMLPGGCEAIEMMELDRAGKIRRSRAHFAARVALAVA